MKIKLGSFMLSVNSEDGKKEHESREERKEEKTAVAEEKKEERKEEKKEENSEKIDIIKALKEHQKLLLIISVLLIAYLCFYIRTMNVPALGNKLLALDPWVFARETYMIIDKGTLPAIDYMRNFPTGYPTDYDSILLPYVFAYTYKILNVVMPNLSAMTVMQMSTPFSTFISIIFFYLLVSKFYNRKLGLLAALSLAVVPGYLFRTIAGFYDKEGLVMPLLFAALYFYVCSIKSKDYKKSAINSVISGVITGIAGMTWGGWIFVLYAVAGYMTVQVLTDNVTKKSIVIQLFWMIPIALSGLFTNRYDIIKLIAFDLNILPLIGMIVRIYAYPYIDKKFKNLENIPPGITSIVIAGLISIAAATIFLSPSYTINQITNIVKQTSNPLGPDVMSQSVSENQQPFLIPDWVQNFGYYYLVLIYLGIVLMIHESVRKVYKNDVEAFLKITLPYGIFFAILMLSRYQAGSSIMNFFNPLYEPSYLLIMAWVGFVFLMDWKKRDFKKIDKASFLIILLFTIVAISAIGGVRLIFVFAPMAVIAGSYFIVKCYELARDSVKDKFYKYLIYAVIAGIFFLLVINPFNISLGNSNLPAVTSFYSTITAEAPSFGPSVYGDWDQSYSWIANNTPANSVFSSWWDYGYWIQALGNRTTVTDGGNARADWNYLMGRYLFGGTNISQVYNVLRDLSSPNYFYVVSDDVGKFYQMERIGNRNTYYTLLTVQTLENTSLPGVNSSVYPETVVYQPTTGAVVLSKDFTVNGKLFAAGQTYVLNIFLPISANGTFASPLAGVYNAAYGQILLPINGICQENIGCSQIASGGVPGNFYLIRNGGIWVPDAAAPMFMTQQYLLNKTIPGFNLVWQSSAPLDEMQTILGSRENIRIYKINYTAMEDAIASNYTWS